MIKFLLSSIALFLLYLGFSILTNLDSAIIVDIYDYHVETTFFTVVFVLLLVLVTTLWLLRLIFLLFEIPSIIRQKYQLNKTQKIYANLLQAFANLSQQKNKKALEIIQKIMPDLNHDQKQLAHLISVNAEDRFDEQIAHSKILLHKSEYAIYAAKKMAQLLVANKLYDQAEEYALQCYNNDAKDFEILKILIFCYGNLQRWDRFDYIANKIINISQADYSSLTQKISEFYLVATKQTLANGNEKKASEYLSKSLQANSCNIQALDLYVTLNIAKNQAEDTIKMLKNSYRAKPSFEIALLLIRVLASLPAKQIYIELINIIDTKEQPALNLAIAAYLGLEPEDTTNPNKLLN